MLWWVIPAYLLAAAAYEAALALGAAGVGREPGAGAPGEDVVAFIALLFTIAALILLGVATLVSRDVPALAAFAPAGAAFVLARYFTYDPYYAPNLRRYSDGSGVPLWWIVFLAAASAGAGLLTLVAPREGRLASVLALGGVLLVFMGLASH